MNKQITYNNKTVINLEIDGIKTWDSPDFVDAFFSYGEYDDGTQLTDQELENLADANQDVLHEMIYDELY